MKRTLFTACLLSLPLVSAACLDVTDEEDPEADLPGDRDNNPDGDGGKGDAWDYTNDPARLARNLEYRLAELPRQGKMEKPVWASRYPGAVGRAPIAWADTYWPSAQLSTNNRWMGRTTKSPLEKYDAAFNNAPGCEAQPDTTCGPTAKAKWDEYLACAGPAARWQMTSFQTIRHMFDGIDNDNKDGVDTCSSSDDEGPQGWWGLCHAWAPAALLEPEPLKAVTYGGQRFEVADIKGLIQTVYDRTDAMMLGGRCNAMTIEHDGMSSANEECQDVNPGALHVILGNFLGINDMALVEDRTASGEVWNQPLVGYNVTKQEEVTAARANECVGATGDTWTYNRQAKKLVEVEVTTDYLVEGNASARPLGMNGYVHHDSYHYILELGATGKIIGGRYCTESVDDHPDFLWAPVGVSTSSYGRNPNVSLEKVRTLINLSLQADDNGGGGASDKTYETTTATAIPDNDPAGASVSLAVTDSFTFKSLSASVDIAHTWRGDLRVELLKNGATVATLHDRTGGSADDVTGTFTFTPSQLGGDAGQATWTLKVTDGAAQDVGTIKLFKLVFSL
ncbi:MAG: proprotein convertase P-domain-containing protein [Kofleriaceae bacterium]|nr:proprotein convertase P-domain-containing protein [Kofleriaceae bacterium]MCL4224453.1 proprotein convertase P-domain-containing protein [Myxococcales bacterium]